MASVINTPPGVVLSNLTIMGADPYGRVGIIYAHVGEFTGSLNTGLEEAHQGSFIGSSTSSTYITDAGNEHDQWDVTGTDPVQA